MNDFLLYILKSTFCLSVLYLAFIAVMRKEAFFGLNRLMLILIVVFSFIVPLLYLPATVKPIIQEQIISQVSFYESEPASAITVSEMDKTTPAVTLPGAVQKQNPFPYSAGQIIFLIYLAGMFLSLIIFIQGIVSVLFMLRKAKAVRKDGYRVFILEKDIPAFSFCKMIFISRKDYTEHGKTILTHEIQHIRLGHFYDLMLMEIVKMVHWFNPIIYWLIKDLKAIHEFQADQHTLTSGIDANKYQLLIIEKGVGSQRFALANSFNHCQIKKRITMMNKQMTNKAGMWKVATFLPLLALLLMAFGRTGENVSLGSQPQKAISNQKSTQVKDTTAKEEESAYRIVEIMPEFPGGNKGLVEYIAKSVHYPQEALTKKIKGKVSVQFIVNKEGKVMNAKVTKSVDPALDAEALRVINQMPNWRPGKQAGKPVSVYTTVPVNFVLSPGPTDKNVPGESPSEKKVLNQEKSNDKGSATQTKDSIYKIVDVMPQFPGGDIALNKWLQKNMKYPKEATAKNIQGKVFVSFIINKEGKILNPKVTKGVDPLLDAEALRVVKIMPNWIPGKDKGKTVSVSYALPLNFVLE